MITVSSSEKNSEESDSGVFGLSPPHDGSEFEQLFPDLAGLISVQDTPLAPKLTTDYMPMGSGEEKVSTPQVLKIKIESPRGQQLLIDYLQQQKSTTKEEDHGDLDSHSTTSSADTNHENCAAADSLKIGGSCNKAALNAKLNRKKKKQYVEGLEQSVERLTVENSTLKSENKEMATTLESLKTEVDYLKEVLANQSELSSLLVNIKGTRGVRFHSTLLASEPPPPADNRKRKLADEAVSSGISNDHGYCSTSSGGRPVTRASSKKPCSRSNASQQPALGGGGTGAGVCLHVANSAVSLEFCPRCSSNARMAAKASQLC